MQIEIIKRKTLCVLQSSDCSYWYESESVLWRRASLPIGYSKAAAASGEIESAKLGL